MESINYTNKRTNLSEVQEEIQKYINQFNLNKPTPQIICSESQFPKYIQELLKDWDNIGLRNNSKESIQKDKEKIFIDLLKNKNYFELQLFLLDHTFQISYDIYQELLKPEGPEGVTHLRVLLNHGFMPYNRDKDFDLRLLKQFKSDQTSQETRELIFLQEVFQEKWTNLKFFLQNVDFKVPVEQMCIFLRRRGEYFNATETNLSKCIRKNPDPILLARLVENFDIKNLPASSEFLFDQCRDCLDKLNNNFANSKHEDIKKKLIAFMQNVRAELRPTPIYVESPQLVRLRSRINKLDQDINWLQNPASRNTGGPRETESSISREKGGPGGTQSSIRRKKGGPA